MKNKKMIFAVAIVVILIIAIIAFVMVNKIQKSDEQKVHTNVENTESKNEEIELNKEQLGEIANYLNQSDNNGFLLSSYNSPSEIDLYYIISEPKFSVTEEEFTEYEQLASEEVTTGLYKATSEEIKNLLVTKFGAQFVDNMNTENCHYLEQNDSYYTLCGDDLHVDIVCTKGVKKENTYIVDYESKEKTGIYIKGRVTLADGYLFISNELEETL